MTDILRYSRAYGNFQRHFVKVIAKGRDELSERFETAEEAIEHIKSQGLFLWYVTVDYQGFTPRDKDRSEIHRTKAEMIKEIRYINEIR